MAPRRAAQISAEPPRFPNARQRYSRELGSAASSFQAELLRLKAGDSVSIQGTGKLGVFEMNGEHRPSFEVVASHVLALRQPAKPRRDDEAAWKPVAELINDEIPFLSGGSPLSPPRLLGMISGPASGSWPR